MTTRFIATADGVKLAWHERGSGPLTFVFQHGLGGAAGQPAEVLPDDPGVRFATLECRGHGQSEAGDPARFSISQFADDLAEVIERGGVPVILGGISMGAAIALRLAVRRPDLVRALVLARPAWAIGPAPETMAPNAEVGALLAKHESSEARQLFLASPTAAMLRAEAPDNLASLVGFFVREPIEITSSLLTRISSDGPGVSADDVAILRLPVLVIGHEADHIHPIHIAERLAALIPNAELRRITPKAHDKAAYVADFQIALSEFLQKVTQAKA